MQFAYFFLLVKNLILLNNFRRITYTYSKFIVN